MIKTRFAPSPTGFLHIGSLRTALYAYLFAKANNGKLILRIEDTDQSREVEGAQKHIIEILKTCGIEIDEGPEAGGENGPYIQSKRLSIYKEHVNKLIKDKKAYHCFCTPERLTEMREKQLARKKAPMYDRKCLELSEEELQEKLNNNEPHVIRMKVPHDQTVIINDEVRGKVRFECKNIDDQVILKSDGFPTYHLACVVDDHLMGITHVVRAEEWLPSTPKHALLYQFFNWEAPSFAHLPLILNDQKQKLSKRHGSVHVEAFLEDGICIEALINFISLLGWHPGTKNEIYSLTELIENFSLEKVHKAGAIFNREKLIWFNWQWTRRKYIEIIEIEAKKINPDITLNNRFKFIFDNQIDRQNFDKIRANTLYELVQTHLKTNQDIEFIKKCLPSLEDKILQNPNSINEIISFYNTITEYTPELFIHEKMKVDLKQAKQSLESCLKTLEELKEEEFTEEKIKNALIETITNLGIKNGQLLWPVRAALSGEQFSPGVFEICEVLGKEESIKRLKAGIKKI